MGSGKEERAGRRDSLSLSLLSHARESTNLKERERRKGEEEKRKKMEREFSPPYWCMHVRAMRQERGF